MRALANEASLGDMPIDAAVYQAAGRDLSDPVLLGSGSLGAPVGIFGRDPGRHEVLLGEPFIGAGGRLVRDGLHRRLHGGPAPDTAAAIDAGRGVFWANTVPFKPLGNKAWSMKIKRRFSPHIARLIGELWTGTHLITLGNVAFDWFRIEQPDLKPQLKAHWAREDRYEADLEIEFRGRRLVLHPLPHPSPLNARWYPRFPDLLDQRLARLGWPG